MEGEYDEYSGFDDNLSNAAAIKKFQAIQEGVRGGDNRSEDSDFVNVFLENSMSTQPATRPRSAA